MIVVSSLFSFILVPSSTIIAEFNAFPSPINNGFKIRILNIGQKYGLSDIYDR
jgi:hypothetical protein